MDGGQEDLFASLQAVVDENRENLKTATTSLAEVGPKLEEVVEKVQSFVDDASSEDSTLGRLLTDKETFGKIEKIATDVEKMTDQIARGEGTMGKLIFSEEGLQEIKDSLAEVQAAFTDIRTLLEDNKQELTDAIGGLKDVGPTVEKAAKNLEEITTKINEGEGTLARVINDPGLYDEAKSAFTQIQQTFEEAEEQTVLQSFLRIFTGAI
jgi:phospholipid/cholesterol/gamma-HCH transport system substrate-binding protein